MNKTCSRISQHGADVEFVSCGGTPYLSVGYHRRPSNTKHPKAIWAVSRPYECHLFCTAEAGQWIDVDGNLWALAADATVELGFAGERLAFFPKQVNPTDHWHGYPVSGRRSSPMRQRPPDNIVEQWHKNDQISFTVFERIMSGRL